MMHKIKGRFYQDREFACDPETAEHVLTHLEWDKFREKIQDWKRTGVASIAYEIDPDDDDIELMVLQGVGIEDNHYMLFFIERESGGYEKRPLMADVWARDIQDVEKAAIELVNKAEEEYIEANKHEIR